MALTLALQQVSAVSVAGQPTYFVMTATNTGASAAALTSWQVSESTESDAYITQPQLLTLNVPAGQGNPVLAPSGSVTSPAFAVFFPSPYAAGPSPNIQGLGPNGMMPGQPPDNFYTLLAQGQLSDGSSASVTLVVTVLSATAPFPVPQGGAAQFNQGANSAVYAAVLL
jgi:hypothetical protein